MVYIYAQEEVRGAPLGGLQASIGLFRAAFPEAVVVTPSSAPPPAAEGDIVFVPAVFNLRGLDGKALFLPHLGFLCTTRATTICSVVWESPAVPTHVLPTFPRADILHVPSRFLADVFRHPEVVYYPYAVGDFPRRREPPRSGVIGVVISSFHHRKDPANALARLASLLPNRTIVVVGIGLRKERFWAGTPLPSNIVVEEYVGTQSLVAFYHMVDWFVVLSGGEGFCLPAREALRCGVPVIAPRHTAFRDLEGVRGVYLVDCTPWSDENHPLLRGVLWYVPKVEEIAEIIRRESPPPPDEVEDPTPRVDDWVRFWRKTVETMRKVQVSLREKPAAFVLYPEPWGLGLNVVARRWARIANWETFTLHYGRLPQGYKGVLILPYYYLFTDLRCDETPNTSTLLLLRHLRSLNPQAFFVLWVHNYLPKEIWSRHFADIFNLVAVTTEEMRRECFFGLSALILPLPLGDPPAAGRQPKEHFLYWGINYTSFPFLAAFAPHFPHPIRVLFPTGGEYKHGLMSLLRTKGVVVNVVETLTDEQLEKELDEAAGYLCFDFHIPLMRGEASARIPAVLRKGRPVIANNAPRAQVWGQYIPLVPCSMDVEVAKEEAPRIARYVADHLQEFVPSNVPPPEEDVKIAQRFLEQVLRAKEVSP